MPTYLFTFTMPQFLTVLNLFIIIHILFSSSVSATDLVQAYFNRPSPNIITGSNSESNLSQTPSNRVPSNRCGKRIYDSIQTLKDINSIDKELDLLIYELNDEVVISALLAAARNSVSVRIIIESKNFKGVIKSMIRGHNKNNDNKIQVKLLKGSGKYGVMHHKIVLTKSVLMKELYFGSYNITNNAAKYSYENCSRIAHIHKAMNNQPAIPRLEEIINNYQSEFNALWELSEQTDSDFLTE